MKYGSYGHDRAHMSFLKLGDSFIFVRFEFHSTTSKKWNNTTTHPLTWLFEVVGFPQETCKWKSFEIFILQYSILQNAKLMCDSTMTCKTQTTLKGWPTSEIRETLVISSVKLLMFIINHSLFCLLFHLFCIATSVTISILNVKGENKTKTITWKCSHCSPVYIFTSVEYSRRYRFKRRHKRIISILIFCSIVS